jgi:hypothetical protein
MTWPTKNRIYGWGWPGTCDWDPSTCGDWGPGVSFWEPLRILRIATRVDRYDTPPNWVGEYWTTDGNISTGDPVRLVFALSAQEGIGMMSARLIK